VTVIERTTTVTPADVCAALLGAVRDALMLCDRDVQTAYVAAGTVAWDNCCGQLVVAPERVYRTARFPVEGPDENGCFDGFIALDVVVLLLRCVPVIENDGTVPDDVELGLAYADVLHDAAVIYDVLATTIFDPEWERANESQSFVGAEGGCVGVETRMTIGVDAELWCAQCAPGGEP
jgi:hypothetical protein